MSFGDFDFILVGAGSAGCVLANRLSADARNRVALLEAGPHDRRFWIRLPIGYGRTMWDPVVNWQFYTEPDPNMDGRRIYWPRGRVLGGSSSINGLIAIRGHRDDYDHWARLGNIGWSWNDVLPYFVKLESNPDHAESQLHGSCGPIAVSSIKRRHELIESFIASAQAHGIPRTDDFNGESQEGAGYYQLTMKDGWRVSAANAYLRPVRRRQNLRVITNRAGQARVVRAWTRRWNRMLRGPRGVRYLGAARCDHLRRGNPVAAPADVIGNWSRGRAPTIRHPNHRRSCQRRRKPAGSFAISPHLSVFKADHHQRPIALCCRLRADGP
jgi:choline dehydrogenase-like flavoprotein